MAGRGRGMAWNYVAPLGAAVLVLVLILVDTICVGGERSVGGIVGAAGAVEVHCLILKEVVNGYHSDSMPPA